MAGVNRAPPQAGSVPPLAGYTVAIASDRRRHRLADLLESVGAKTVGVQAARSVAKPVESRLREATSRVLAGPCHELVISSALGLRAWLTGARRWGLAEELVARFAGARLLARDPAAADALRAFGLREVFSTDGESTEELLRYLLAQPLAGRTVVVQTHQLALTEACTALTQAGAKLIEVPTFTPSPPAETFSLRRLCDLVVRRQIDALALIGPTIADQVWTQASRDGLRAELLAALRSEVLCAGLGPASIAPLAEARPLAADPPFVAELAEALLTSLPQRALTVISAGHRLELRGHAIVLDGRLVPVQAGPLAVLRALAHHPGEVLSTAQIRATIPHQNQVDDHAVEMAVSRLRQALRTGGPGASLGSDGLVQTIVKHGYRLTQ